MLKFYRSLWTPLLICFFLRGLTKYHSSPFHTIIISEFWMCVVLWTKAVNLDTWVWGGPGVLEQGGIPPQILVDQLTLSLLKRAENAHQITNWPPDFHAFLWPWGTKRNHLISNIGTPWKKRSINRNLNYWKRTLWLFPKINTKTNSHWFAKFTNYGGRNLPPLIGIRLNE